MKISAALFLLLLLTPVLRAQTRHPRAPRRASPTALDRLGLTCTQILAITSTDWVAKFNKEKGSTPEATERAIAAYGNCYDERTAHLAALLTRKRVGPPKNARADFVGFEGAVKNFTQTATADAQTPPDAAKLAYINLYAKQFGYDFYRQYEERNLNPPLTPDQDLEFTKAKNRFGELIGLLSPDKTHEVHAAFGEIVGTHQVSMAIKFTLYKYAIFILEPPSPGKPFAPPPF
jgi:hypothetical protein